MKRIIILLLVLIPAGLAVAQQFNGRDPSSRTRRNGVSGRPGSFNRPPTAAATDAQALPAIDPRNLQPRLPETYLILGTRAFSPAMGGLEHLACPVGPQTQWAFRGAALQDGKYTAFLEDTVTHSISNVFDGQTVAGGQVAQISLDTLSYIRDDRKTAVRIGQNLAGFAAPAFDMTRSNFTGQPGGRGGPLAGIGRGSRGDSGSPNSTGNGRGRNPGRGTRGGTPAAAPASTPEARTSQATGQPNTPDDASGEQVAEADAGPADAGGAGFDGPPDVLGPGGSGPADFGGPAWTRELLAQLVLLVLPEMVPADLRRVAHPMDLSKHPLLSDHLHLLPHSSQQVRRQVAWASGLTPLYLPWPQWPTLRQSPSHPF